MRALAVSIAALALLALPAAALAKSGDRNHDRIPDKWEKKHHLSTKRHGVAKQNPDGDTLNNLAEFRSGTDPQLADSDGDGTPDGSEDPDRDGVDNDNEAREHTNPRRADSNGNRVRDGREDADRDGLDNSGEDQSGDDPIDPDSDDNGVPDGRETVGKVDSFDGTTLTVSLFNGGTLAGTVDGDTEVDCDDGGDDWAAKVAFRRGGLPAPGPAGVDGTAPGGDGGAPAGDDPAGDAGDDLGDDAGGDESGDAGDDHAADGSGNCSLADIAPGAIVKEAALQLGPDGTWFSELALAP